MEWENWNPRERANLCFIRANDRLLLIRKKRGLGAGKINAPGGKIEPGESALESTIRETQEEVGVTPRNPVKHGELRFQFVDGYSLHCTVFQASGCDGEPVETDEAAPFWAPLDHIPYDEMWADDACWLPQMLQGRKFQGSFVFDGDLMLSHHVEIVTGFSDCAESLQ